MSDIHDAYQVTEDIEGSHPRLPEYKLLKGDLVVNVHEGSWYKFAPGMAVSGFFLTDEQEAKLKPVRYMADGLTFTIVEDE